MRRKAWFFFLLATHLLAQNNYAYTAFFIQRYQPSSTPNAPDSIDVYLCMRRSPPFDLTYPVDTLASSNFPFFYNTTALNFSGARILYRNKFHYG